MSRHTVTATESGIYMPSQQSLYNTAHACLLTPYDLDDRQLDDVFAQIMTHQVDYADLYFQYSRAEGWSLEEGIVKSGSFNIDQGVGVRAVAGEKTAFAYSDDISLPALSQAAQATRAIARQGAGRATWGEPATVQASSVSSAEAPSSVGPLVSTGRYGARKLSARSGNDSGPETMSRPPQWSQSSKACR